MSIYANTYMIHADFHFLRKLHNRFFDKYYFFYNLLKYYQYRANKLTTKMNWDDLLSTERRRKSEINETDRRDFSDNNDNRNQFESDFGRVIFSSSCRRLHDKTQVFPLTSDDNIHSRLTHSLEVMNIGLSFSIFLCNNSVFTEKSGLDQIRILREVSPILKTSCLIHDLGNPPFGHFGEIVIQEYFNNLFNNIRNKSANYILEGLSNKTYVNQSSELNQFLSNPSFTSDYTEFDGNAEGFRILTKLQYLGDLFGLNLTYATLASTLKYPNYNKADTKYIGTHKHGVFFTERDILEDIANKCHLNKEKGYIRHPFAFLMEAADSICYYIMDIEDAIQKQWIKYEDLIDQLKMLNIQQSEKILTITKRYQKKQWVDLRTRLISYLMGVAINNFINNIDRILEGDYNSELIGDDELAKFLKKESFTKILSSREIQSLEVTGEAVITGIFNEYIKYFFHKNKAFRDRGKTLISKSIFMTVLHEHLEKYHNDKNFINKYGEFDISTKNRCDSIENLYNKFDVADFTAEERFRIIRDFVACMTDKFALNHFHKLNGQKI